MKTQRAVVVGAGGRLGRAVSQDLLEQGYQVVGLTRAELDVTDRLAVRRAITGVSPQLVVNCTAYNAVDAAETDQDSAFRANARAPRFLAESAAAAGAIFVHYSTDFVFDGRTSEPYAEGDQTNPLSVYGASKLAGEAEVSRVCNRYYVLRVSSLFGGVGVRGHRATVDFMAAQLLDGKSIRAAVDRTVSPSYVPDVAVTTRRLYERSAPFGIYHAVSGGMVTWFQLAEFVASALGVEPRIESARASELRAIARRPEFCALSSDKLKATGVQVHDWQSAVMRHLDETAASVSPILSRQSA